MTRFFIQIGNYQFSSLQNLKDSKRNYLNIFFFYYESFHMKGWYCLPQQRYWGTLSFSLLWSGQTRTWVYSVVWNVWPVWSVWWLVMKVPGWRVLSMWQPLYISLLCEIAGCVLLRDNCELLMDFFYFLLMDHLHAVVLLKVHVTRHFPFSMTGVCPGNYIVSHWDLLLQFTRGTLCRQWGGEWWDCGLTWLPGRGWTRRDTWRSSAGGGALLFSLPKWKWLSEWDGPLTGLCRPAFLSTVLSDMFGLIACEKS